MEIICYQSLLKDVIKSVKCCGPWPMFTISGHILDLKFIVTQATLISIQIAQHFPIRWAQ